jgi:hypothetical protein
MQNRPSDMGARESRKWHLTGAVIALCGANQAESCHLLEIVSALPGAGGIVPGHTLNQRQVFGHPLIAQLDGIG